MDDLDDDDLSLQHAWSITARLAAIDVNREEGLSAELKGLIEKHKDCIRPWCKSAVMVESGDAAGLSRWHQDNTRKKKACFSAGVFYFHRKPHKWGATK